jgi:ribonucleoside-diphosphate reductase alpha chain
MMRFAGFPVEDSVSKPDEVDVFSFPMKCSDASIYRNDLTAIEQLETWLVYQTHWCEHKPSVTIYVKDDEWLDVAAWVYKHFDELSGVSFLPYDGGSYQQAPYQEITKEEYEQWLLKMPKDVDWSLLGQWEKEDMTSGSKTLACSGASCELVDLIS